MITIPQCRAARGMLDWTQQDLADASGLSKTAINNYEKGNSDIKSDSLRAIQKAFEHNGIAFTADEGLKRKSDQSTTLSGPHALTELLHDITQAISAEDEVLFFNADARAPSPDEKNQVAMYADEIKFKHPRKRILCQAGETSRYGQGESVQYLPSSAAFFSASQIIYGSKVATLLWQSDTIQITDSSAAAQAERARFETCWINSAPIKKGAQQSA